MGREYLLQRSDSSDAAGFEKDDFGGQAPNFGQIVRDINDADLKREQARQNIVRGGVVEAGERLIEQKEVRSRS